MNYKDNGDYKAYKLKVNILRPHLSVGSGLALQLEKLEMFAEDAFEAQQATIDRLEQENADLIELIMLSNARVHYMAIQVAKQVARDKK